MSNNSQFSQQFDKIRIEMGLKQNELAELLGYSSSTISRIRNGERKLSSEMLKILIRNMWHAYKAGKYPLWTEDDCKKIEGELDNLAQKAQND